MVACERRRISGCLLGGEKQHPEIRLRSKAGFVVDKSLVKFRRPFSFQDPSMPVPLIDLFTEFVIRRNQILSNILANWLLRKIEFK